MAADREITVSATSPGVWAGRTASASALFDPATLVPCGTSVADVCDTTLVHVDGDGTLALELKAGEGTPDVDLYVYRSDSFGFAGALAGVAAELGADEAVRLPNASGTYLVRAVSFATGAAGFAGAATLTPPSAAPDVDGPRGRQETLVSDHRAGAASQPVVAVNPRDRDVIVAAYRVFPDPAAYVSQIATAVSFDRGERWLPLGAVSSAPSANPALAFTDDGDALLVTNEQSATWGLTVRRWSRPSRNDVARRRTWEAPAELASPPADSTDERPVLAAGRDGAVMACWARTTDLGAFGRQAVLCRHSADAGTTWADPSRPSPGQFSGVPYGPYVGGVALARHRGAFTVAWVDTLAGALDGSGLDSAWVARSDGTGWRAPVRAALFRPLPDRFAGDSFRNVTLLSLAGSRERLYLAFGADSGDHADVRLVRSDDAGAHWGDPVTVGTGARDQFQPSVAVTRDSRVHVSFLDRRLDPGSRFADEWIASSRDAGTSWRERRLSHDSWDPAVGAPHSPTGDLLGDHQALAAAGCTLVALAADPHLALRRDRKLPRTELPQLFAWTLRASRRC